MAPFAPLIKPKLSGKTSLSCQSSSGTSPLYVTWIKDGTVLQDSSFVRIQSSNDPSMLIIDSITSSHSGNYTCKMSNRFGHDSYTTELVVEGKILIEISSWSHL